MKKIILALFILCISINIFGKAGPEIPLPVISASEAIDLASNYFYGGKTKRPDQDYFKIEDYILISVKYTNNFNEEKQTEWAWEIKFVHPVQNDHSLTYKITNDGKVIETGSSR